MKNAMSLAALIVSLAVVSAKAITVNPASNVTGDSANTPETVVYRDTAGSFAGEVITAEDVTVNDDLTVTDDVTFSDDLTADNIGVSTNVLSNLSLHVVAENASSTATVITAAASQTADLFRARNSSLTVVYRIGPVGHVGYRQYTKADFDTLVPDFVGAMAQCSDCTLTYSVCRATGTAAAQWAREGSATVGCGSGE